MLVRSRSDLQPRWCGILPTKASGEVIGTSEGVLLPACAALNPSVTAPTQYLRGTQFARKREEDKPRLLMIPLRPSGCTWAVQPPGSDTPMYPSTTASDSTWVLSQDSEAADNGRPVWLALVDVTLFPQHASACGWSLGTCWTVEATSLGLPLAPNQRWLRLCRCRGWLSSSPAFSAWPSPALQTFLARKLPAFPYPQLRFPNSQ